MPSKLLLAAARIARDARGAETFGVRTAPVRVDGRAVMARVQRERDHFVAGVLKEVAAIPARTKVHGRARFADPRTLAVDDHSLVTAKAIVIATGARAIVPETLEAACGDRVLTHETVFELDDLPKSLGVIGAGPLGLELAIAFARLGVKTTLFDEGDVVGAVRDPVVAEAVASAMAKELDLQLGVKIEARLNASGEVAASWKDAAGKAKRRTFEYVLVAAGQAPQIEGLDLNMAGLAVDDDGVPEFDRKTLRCGDSAIFIAGDSNADRPVLHEASLQGEQAGLNAARYPKLEPRVASPDMAVIYTDPDIARVGSGFDPDQAKDWKIGCSDSNGRARVDGRASGVVRVYADKEGVLLGGELFGPDAEHLAHLLAWVVQLGLNAEKALELPFYHPTLEETLRTALRDLADQAD